MIKSENTGTPKLKVAFRLNEKGNPMVIDKDSVKHYKIHVSVEETPNDVYSVNYILHPSYINPFREERNRDGGFGFDTTTYGDYVISAELKGKKGNAIISTLVSESLEKSHQPQNPALMEALKNIREA